MTKQIVKREDEPFDIGLTGCPQFRYVVDGDRAEIDVSYNSIDGQTFRIRPSRLPANMPINIVMPALDFLTSTLAASIQDKTYEFLSSIATIVLDALSAEALHSSTRLTESDASTIIELLEEMTAVLVKAKQLQDALTLWMRWLVLPYPAFVTVKSLPTAQICFEPLVLAFMQSSHSNQYKFCLAILRALTGRADRDLNYDIFKIEILQKAQFVKAYAEYCSLFEIIVMGRYVNQIQECLTLLPSPQKGKRSLVADVWWLLLFQAALDSNNDQIRKMVGTWLLENYVTNTTDEDSVKQVQASFFDSLLAWSTHGQLAYRSIVRDGRSVHSEHCDMLYSYCERQAIINHVFAEHTLQWLHDHIGTLNQHSTVYILRAFSHGNVTHTMAEYAALLAEKFKFSPLLRLLARKYCLELIEKYTLDHAEPGDHSNKAAEELRSRIQQSYDFLNGDVAPFLLSIDCARLVQKHAQDILQRFQSKGYVEVQNFTITIDWDRLTRYDPHQSLWKVLAESWPYWAEEMLRNGASEDNVTDLVADCITNFFRLSRRKTFLWGITAKTLRRLYFEEVLNILQHPDIVMAILSFINDPPIPSPEHLLDVAVAAGEVDEHDNPVYNVFADETLGHAYVLDMLSRLRSEHRAWGLDMLDKLLDPWQKQIEPISVVSKWKHTSQLQAMVILLHSCVRSYEHIDKYYAIFCALLVGDPNPRNRFLLEWASLYLASHSSPRNYLDETLHILEKSDPSNPSPKLVASQIKIAVQLILHHKSSNQAEKATLTERLLTILVTLIGSSRVPIRFEAQASYPIVYDYAVREHMVNVVPHTPVFTSVYKFITSLDKYKRPPEARVLCIFDMTRDMNMATLFEGGYLYIPQSEPPLLYASDIKEIIEDDTPDIVKARPEAHIHLGTVDKDAAGLISNLKTTSSKSMKPLASEITTTTGPLQTKSFATDLSSLSLTTLNDAPQTNRGSGPILIGTLLDAPVNLGGLSRAANVFGCHSLHIPSLSILQNNSFKNVSLNSELHIDIVSTPPASLLTRLRALQAEGWSIVGLEQTNDSVVIGAPSPPPSSTSISISPSSSTDTERRLPHKSAIVIGAESTGIPADILFACDLCVEIKQWGVTRSLNVQTAAAVVLFEWRREWGGTSSSS